MANKHIKVQKIISQKLISRKQTWPELKLFSLCLGDSYYPIFLSSQGDDPMKKNI